MDVPAQKLMTVGDIGRLLGVPFYDVRYMLSIHTEIEPVQRAGTYRLFDQAGLEQIRQAIAAKRPAPKGEPLTI